MRILLADSQAKVRSALRLLLEHELGPNVVGEVVEAAELLASLQMECADLVLLDWNLPGAKPEEMVATLRRKCPACSIVVLSGRPEEYQDALSCGVDAFISKADPPEKLVYTLRQVAAGVGHHLQSEDKPTWDIRNAE